MKFVPEPVAIENPDLGRVRLAHRAVKENGEWVVDYSAMDAVGYRIVAEISEYSNEVRFVGDDNLKYVIREVRPSDSQIAQNHPYFGTLPLPVEIIGAIMNNTIGPVSLYAAVDGDGDVHTMILWTDNGLYARYARAWVRIADASSVASLTLLEVDEVNLDAYDAADETGRVLTRGALVEPESAPVGTSAPPIIETAGTTMLASAPIVAPIIASLEDLPTAIEYATDNEGARWYTSKRAKALGHTEALPWENDQ